MVPYLRQSWERGASLNGSADSTLLAGLRLGTLETIRYLHQEQPSSEAFEAWVLAKNDGSIPAERLRQLNAALAGEISQGMGSAHPPVLSAEDLAFRGENGYVVVHDAVPPESRDAAARAICEFPGADTNVPDSWYGLQGHSIRIPILRHPAFQANHECPRVHRAFAQFWGRDSQPAKPITGRAGDLVIWHHALPHGSSPNRNSVPRVVQYLTMLASQQEVNPIWK